MYNQLVSTYLKVYNRELLPVNVRKTTLTKIKILVKKVKITVYTNETMLIISSLKDAKNCNCC